MSGQNAFDDLTVDDPRFAAALTTRIAEMREMLAAMAPDSTSTALRALRDAFPDVPLNARVRVLSELRH
jgi:hypothetical protein